MSPPHKAITRTDEEIKKKSIAQREERSTIFTLFFAFSYEKSQHFNLIVIVT
jgi:hypothetical protein